MPLFLYAKCKKSIQVFKPRSLQTCLQVPSVKLSAWEQNLKQIKMISFLNMSHPMQMHANANN